jgi:hypothetical protein
LALPLESRKRLIRVEGFETFVPRERLIRGEPYG